MDELLQRSPALMMAACRYLLDYSDSVSNDAMKRRITRLAMELENTAAALSDTMEGI